MWYSGWLGHLTQLTNLFTLKTAVFSFAVISIEIHYWIANVIIFIFRRSKNLILVVLCKT